MPKNLGVWFPTIRAQSGVDVFTKRLTEALKERGIRSEITWLPHRAEYAPWTVAVPEPPRWATVAHVNSWLHRRFLPSGIPYVVTVHSSVHNQGLTNHKTYLQTRYHRYWVRRREYEALRGSAFITAVSRYTADETTKEFGHQNVATVFNWVDPRGFHAIPRDRPNKPFRLLFVGHLRRLKGIDLLPKIMSELGDDFELRYTGTPSEFRKIAEPSHNMIPLGWLNGVRELVHAYQEADALLFPTRLEGFSLVVLEAQACGLPVISTNVASIPEVVINGETGIICDEGNISGLVAGSRQLKDNVELWRRMRVNSVSMTSNRFTEKQALDSYISIYHRVVSRA